MEIMLAIVVMSLVSVVLWLGLRLFRRQAAIRSEPEPGVTIADPRLNPVVEDYDPQAWVTELALSHNALHIYVHDYPPGLNVGFLEQLLTEFSSDLLLFTEVGEGNEKRIKQRRSHRPPNKSGYWEIVDFTPKNRSEVVDLIRELGEYGYWAFCALPEKNRQVIEKLAMGKGDSLDNSLRGEVDLFDLYVWYNLDRNEIEVFATRPEQYDRIIEIVNNYEFQRK